MIRLNSAELKKKKRNIYPPKSVCQIESASLIATFFVDLTISKRPYDCPINLSAHWNLSTFQALPNEEMTLFPPVSKWIDNKNKMKLKIPSKRKIWMKRIIHKSAALPFISIFNETLAFALRILIKFLQIPCSAAIVSCVTHYGGLCIPAHSHKHFLSSIKIGKKKQQQQRHNAKYLQSSTYLLLFSFYFIFCGVSIMYLFSLYIFYAIDCRIVVIIPFMDFIWFLAPLTVKKIIVDSSIELFITNYEFWLRHIFHKMSWNWNKLRKTFFQSQRIIWLRFRLENISKEL